MEITLERRAYPVQYDELDDSGGDDSSWAAERGPDGLGVHALLISSMAVFVCVVILARLAKLDRSRVVSILDHNRMRNLLSSTQILSCEFYRNIRISGAEDRLTDILFSFLLFGVCVWPGLGTRFCFVSVWPLYAYGF
jgi:hypothetical protein